MFLHLSVILSMGVSASVHVGIPPSEAEPTGSRNSWEQYPLKQTPQRRLLLRTVRILLEYILVYRVSTTCLRWLYRWKRLRNDLEFYQEEKGLSCCLLNLRSAGPLDCIKSDISLTMCLQNEFHKRGNWLHLITNWFPWKLLVNPAWLK